MSFSPYDVLNHRSSDPMQFLCPLSNSQSDTRSKSDIPSTVATNHPTKPESPPSPSLPSSVNRLPFEMEIYGGMGSLQSPMALPALSSPQIVLNDDDDALFKSYRGSSDVTREGTGTSHLAFRRTIRQSETPEPTLTRWKHYLARNYQELRCWVMRRRQEWEDGRLLRLGSRYSFWDPQELHQDRQFLHQQGCSSRLQSVGAVGWAVSILILLIGILWRLYQMDPVFSTILSPDVLSTGVDSSTVSLTQLFHNLTKQHSNFLDIYTNPFNSRQLLLGFNRTVLAEPDHNMILRSSLYRRGTMQLDRHFTAFTPASNDTVVIFCLSADSRYIEMRQVPEGLRSHDPASQRQLDFNLWTGTLVKLPVLGQDETQLGADGSALLDSVFGVVDPSELFAESASVTESQAHANNIRLGLTCRINPATNAYPSTHTSAPLSLIVLLSRLPSDPLPLRSADRRVGYFTSAYIELGPALGEEARREKRESDTVGTTVDSASPTGRTTDAWSPRPHRDCHRLPCLPVESPLLSSVHNNSSNHNPHGTSRNTDKARRLRSATTIRRRLFSEEQSLVFDSFDKPMRIIHRRRIRKTAGGANSVIYYIDPTIPESLWRSVVAGVEEWNKAFVKLGYSNHTIRAVTPNSEEWPSDYSIGNIRYNTISMVADPSSTFGIGPSIVDPRSGEILSSNIVFTSSWMRTWLKAFEIWETVMGDESDEEGKEDSTATTGLETRPDVYDGVTTRNDPHRRDPIIESVGQMSSGAIQLERLLVNSIETETLSEFGKRALFGPNRRRSTDWSQMKDEELVESVFGASLAMIEARHASLQQCDQLRKPWIDCSSSTAACGHCRHVSSLSLLEPLDNGAMLSLMLEGAEQETMATRTTTQSLKKQPVVRRQSTRLLRLLANRFIEAGMKAVTMHEVGHTIGLRHNFKASSGFPFSMRTNSSYIRENGLSPSVMDYLDLNMPMSLFVSGNGTISKEQLLHRLLSHHFFTPTLGAYDYAAVGFGYAQLASSTLSAFEDVNEDADASHLTFASQIGSGGFSTDEDIPEGCGSDPNSNLFDLSDPLQQSIEQLELVQLFQQALHRRLYERSQQLHPNKFTLFQHQLMKRVLTASINLSKLIGGMSIAKLPSSVATSIGPVRPEAADRQLAALIALQKILTDAGGSCSLQQLGDDHRISQTSSASLFPSSLTLPYMTNLEPDIAFHNDFLWSSPDLEYYPKQFSSLITPVKLLRKLLILSVFLPDRLLRVYHISLADSMRSTPMGSVPQQHNATTMSPSMHQSLTIPFLFKQIGLSLFPDATLEALSRTLLYDVQRFWVKFLFYFIDPKFAAMTSDGPVDALTASSALQELRRIKRLLQKFVDEYQQYESLMDPNLIESHLSPSSLSFSKLASPTAAAPSSGTIPVRPDEVQTHQCINTALNFVRLLLFDTRQRYGQHGET